MLLKSTFQVIQEPAMQTPIQADHNGGLISVTKTTTDIFLGRIYRH